MEQGEEVELTDKIILFLYHLKIEGLEEMLLKLYLIPMKNIKTLSTAPNFCYKKFYILILKHVNLILL